MLHGRDGELAAVDDLLTGAREGRSAALVIRGEAGIGKSALLGHAAERARDQLTVLCCSGAEQEMELPFAGLHLLLRGVLDRADALPSRQAASLRGALGLGQEPPRTDRFMIGLAVLSLLADLAGERPLLVLVDDAHWLDRSSAQALLFAARRLGAEGIALILAARDDGPPFAAPGVPELRLQALARTPAGLLLQEHSPGLAPSVRDHVMEQARGNPLALIELPGTLSPQQRAGALPERAVGSASLPERVMRIFRDRLAALPEDTRALLALAAAGDGELGLVAEAAARLGHSLAAAGPAEAAGLIHVGDGLLWFGHPLARTAAYQHAPFTVRLAVHRALAGALDSRPGAALRRAWHLAAAATGPDEDVARALEESAAEARGRGGCAAVSAACERAAQLSADRAGRGRRLATAARAAAESGQHGRAERLAEQALSVLDDPLELAHVAGTRAMVATSRGRTDLAHPTLAAAARALSACPDAAAGLYFEAMTTAWLAGDFPALERVAALSGGDRAHPLWRAMSGLGGLATDEPGQRLPWLREVIEGVRSTGEPAGLQQRAQLAIWDMLAGDDHAARARAVAIEHECRTLGAIGVLPVALLLKARAEMWSGRHREARASAEEGRRVAADTGQPQYANLLTGILAYLSGIEGDEDKVRDLVKEIADTRDPGSAGMRYAALNLLDLAHGRFEPVVRRAGDHALRAPAARAMALLHRAPDVVEAAVRLGRLDVARAVDRRVQDWARLTGQPWSEAVGLRCTALLSEGAEAGAAYARAVRLHRRGGRVFERARTELLHGEWLRRERRSAESRPLLESAMEIFESLGSRPWAERAGAELRAAGKRGPSRRSDQPELSGLLTAQELRIARMAADGMSNREIAARLSISPRTVGYHLHKVFPKLNVAGRGELARLPLDRS
ncbi:helix-turn-helix transcriptional regulator [Nonomuraea sp. SBT364]|uniref:helix-turn-helix transcriptional regulator n=1 Tax=Nonomuraea sp. SBT364 TaxID=1580530 RepID=UPI00066B6F1B|nr:helix-turn-helix transcriptional regulator [Nonomuraea sp. SBT364]